jgi:hypothetical protein
MSEEVWRLRLFDVDGRSVRTLWFGALADMLGFMVKHPKAFRIRKLSGSFGKVVSWEVTHA